MSLCFRMGSSNTHIFSFVFFTLPSGPGLVIPVFSLFSFFLVVTYPRPPVFARPNILVASFATQARACILSDHNIFYTPRGGGNGRVMPLGFFLFFHGHLPQTPSFRSVKQIFSQPPGLVSRVTIIYFAP